MSQAEQARQRVNEFHVCRHLGLKNKVEFMATLDQSPDQQQLVEATDFTRETYKTIVALAKFTQDETIVQTTKNACWNQACRRAELIRSGYAVGFWGNFIPLASLRLLPAPWNVAAFVGAGLIYSKTVGKKMFETQKAAGEADARLAEIFLDLINHEQIKDFLPPESNHQPNPQAIEQLIFSRYADTLWGKVPIAGMFLASLVSGDWLTAVGGTVIIAGLRNLKSKNQIQKLMKSVWLKYLLQGAGMSAELFLPGSTIGASALTAAQATAAEITYNNTELKVSGDNNVFKQFNQSLGAALTERQKGIQYDFRSQLFQILHQDVPDYESFISGIFTVTTNKSLLPDIKNALLETALELAQHVVKSVQLLNAQKGKLEARQRILEARTSEIATLHLGIRQAEQKNDTVDAKILAFTQKLETQVASGDAVRLMLDAYQPLTDLWKKRWEELKAKRQTDQDDWTEQDRYEAMAIKNQVDAFLRQIDQQGATLPALQ